MKHLFLMPVQVTGEEPDLITSIMTKDWAALGGWSLFIMLCLFIVFGAFREWWVPGSRYTRLEVSASKLLESNGQLTTQNGQLIVANEITTHFFKETVPKRGEAPHDDSQLVE
jgi:hypothetical protein